MAEKKKQEDLKTLQKKAPRKRLRKTVRSANGKVFKINRNPETPETMSEISKAYEKNLARLDKDEKLREEKDKFYKQRHLFDPAVQEVIRDMILEDSGLGDLEEALRVCKDENAAFLILKDVFKRTNVLEKVKPFVRIFFERFCQG